MPQISLDSKLNPLKNQLFSGGSVYRIKGEIDLRNTLYVDKTNLEANMPNLPSIVSKQKKYNSRNPISRLLIQNFFNQLTKTLMGIKYMRVLEIGSGEGVLLATLQNQLTEKHVFSLDLDMESVKVASNLIPFVHCGVANAHNLPFPGDAFDLVICCEVLEHVKDPQRVLEEIKRVTKRYCVLTVPNEPIWRLLNMARGSYLSGFGNTPGHINHWSHRTFTKLAAGYFEIIEELDSFPWTGVLCQI